MSTLAAALLLLCVTVTARAAPIELDPAAVVGIDDSIVITYEEEPLGYDPETELYYWLGRVDMPSYLLHVLSPGLYTFDLMLERGTTLDGAVSFDPGLALMLDPDASYTPPAWGWGTPIATVMEPGFYRVVPGLFFLLNDEAEQQRQYLIAAGSERPPLVESVPFTLAITGEPLELAEPEVSFLLLSGLLGLAAARRLGRRGAWRRDQRESE